MPLPDFKGPFMPSMIPAPPKTYIIETEDSETIIRTPVIAWAPDADNPYKAPHPITVDGLARLTPGRAILSPCGMVHDREHPICFADIDEWLAVATKGSVKPPARVVEKPSSKKPSAPAEEAAELEIEWTTSPFKSNSWYRYTKGDVDFIFLVEGGLNPPKQKGAVSKIKRDEFAELKKEIDVAELDDLLEGRYPGMTDLGEDFTGSDDEDEDDDSSAAASALI